MTGHAQYHDRAADFARNTHEAGALTLEQCRELARSHGFTHAVTFGGPVPLESWNPYGSNPGGANYRAGEAAWHGIPTTHEDGAFGIRDAQRLSWITPNAKPGPFALGVWRFERAS